jgi:hypothetical protein
MEENFLNNNNEQMNLKLEEIKKKELESFCWSV